MGGRIAATSTKVLLEFRVNAGMRTIKTVTVSKHDAAPSKLKVSAFNSLDLKI